MSSYQLDIDGSGAQAGAERIVKSFDDIKAAADRMEGGVSAAARKASASFGELQKSVRPISATAVATLKSLSEVFRNFRGPSDAAVRNTIMFLQGLQSVGRLSLGRVSGLAALTAALAGFKGPGSAAGKNTESLLKALARASGLTAPRGLNAMLASMNGFRGPSAAASRNVQSLLNALQSFTAPRGLAGVARALDAITTAANSARASLGSLKTIAVGGVKISGSGGGGGSSGSAISRLTGQHNLLHSAILKTQTLYNSLGGILAAGVFINASNSIIKIRAQLEAATGSVQQARVQFAFLREQTEKLGLEFTSTAKSYGFFLGAIKGTSVTFKEAQDIFRGFSVAARALQLSTSDVDGIFRALGQIMSKGKLQAEELRGQLGDRLPGAFVRFASALDMTKPGELDKALKDGAISGDKLKKAIIEVAQVMELEFSASAEKMSKTVDAAFNRLKNAFTFAAADAGENGLNAAIINITDALTKLVQSEGVSNFFKIVGAAAKVLGNNIELVATILGGVALVSVLKWAAGLLVAFKNLMLVSAAMKGFTALQMAAGLGSIATSAGVASRAFVILNAVIRANPFVIAATAVITLWAAINALSASAKDAGVSNDGLGSSVASIQNFFDSYTSKIWENNSALGAEAQKLRDATIAQLEYNRAKGLGTTDLTQRTGFNIFSMKKVQSVGGNDVSPAVARAFARVTDAQGKYKPISNKEEFQRALRVGGTIDAYQKLNPNNLKGGGALKDLLQSDLANIKAMPREYVIKKYGFDPETTMQRMSPDYNRETLPPGGLSGDPLEKANKKAKGGGGKSEAEQAAEALARAIQTATEKMTDLRTEAEASDRAIAGLISGSLDNIAAAAGSAAQSQLKTFQDALDPSQKQSGVVALAAQLKSAGNIAADIDTTSYEDATAAVLEYMTTLEDLSARRKKAADVAGQVADMRDQNEAQSDYVSMLQKVGSTTASAEKQLEIYNATIGLSTLVRTQMVNGIATEISDRALLADALTREIEKREALKRSLDTTNRQRELESAKMVNQQMAPIYQSGAHPDDVEYYQTMFDTRASLIQQNYWGKELQDRLNIEGAILNEARAAKKLQDEYEKTRQTAADMADAIVGGFKQGMEEGNSFLATMKNIFKSLKDIIFDTLLFNPLKDFLTAALTGAMNGRSNTPGTSTTSTSTPGLVPTSSTIGSVASLANSVVSLGQTVTQISSGARTGTGDVSYKDTNGDIVVRAPTRAEQGRAADTSTIPPPLKQTQDYFSGVKKILNIGVKGGSLGQIGRDRAAGASASQTAGSLMQAGGQAFAAYQLGNTLGKTVAKFLGGGQRTQNVAGGITGGAAAGFSLGGPIGAAIGAVAGGILGFLKKVPKVASSYGSVVVGANGIAGVGSAGKYGPGDKKLGTQMASAGARFFNQFALEFDGMLKAGNYGTFGSRAFEKKGPVESFYSLQGIGKKGKPAGREGVDWIKGTDSQVQAFALIQQVRRGMITGLTKTIQTIFANTKASDMEGLNADLGVGKAYDEFLRGSFKLPDLGRQIQSLNEAFNKLSVQARALGLDEMKLVAARDRMMKQMREEFNFQISQGILGITNPAQAAYNALVEDYKASVGNAMAVGGDLVAVERYYGLKRAELAKQWADLATNGLVTAAKEILYSLKATSASPLNAGSIFGNARDAFQGLATQLRGGDYSNVDKLSTYTQSYLDAARQMFGSSSSYFDIFQQVTDLLNQFTDIAGSMAGGGSTPGSAPSLPSLDGIVAEINAQSVEMINELGLVGGAVMEGSVSIVDAINNLAIALGYKLPGTGVPTTPAPVTPGTGSGYPVINRGGMGENYTPAPVGNGGGFSGDGGFSGTLLGQVRIL